VRAEVERRIAAGEIVSDQGESYGNLHGLEGRHELLPER